MWGKMNRDSEIEGHGIERRANRKGWQLRDGDMYVEDHRRVICTGRRHRAGVKRMFLYRNGDGPEIFNCSSYLFSGSAGSPTFRFGAAPATFESEPAVARVWHDHSNVWHHVTSSRLNINIS
jgi:hypothetical protein